MSPSPSPAAAVTLADLRAANIARQAEWCPDQLPDLSFRGNELAGEAGEAVEALMLHAAELGRLAGRASNLIKKLERERYGWRGSRASKEVLAQELADVVICADLCAVTASIDLAGAVVGKFNATSLAQGLATMLVAKAPGGDDGEIRDAARWERELCAYLAECHTGLWDNATAAAIAGAIRERTHDRDDGVLVSPEAWATVQPVWMLLRHGKALPAELEARIRAALPAAAPPYRSGDLVRHLPTDEVWVVAYADPASGRLAWCGFPNGTARLSDCELVEAVDDGRHRNIFAEVLACGDQRASVARRLYGEPSAPADLPPSAPPEVAR